MKSKDYKLIQNTTVWIKYSNQLFSPSAPLTIMRLINRKELGKYRNANHNPLNIYCAGVSKIRSKRKNHDTPVADTRSLNRWLK